MARSTTKELTSGSPMKLILGFAVPLLFGMLFQQFYSLMDTIIVGRYLGVTALAAVGATGSINFLIIGFCQGICNGFGLPVAQRFGARDYDGVRKYVGNSAILSVLIGGVLTALTVIFCRQILVLMQTPSDIIDLSYNYIVVIFAGIPAIILYNILSSYLRSLGDSITPVIFLIVAAVLNIGLDLFFIICLHWGVFGAAFATVLSQAVSGVLCLFVIIRKFDILHLKRSDWVLDASYVRNLLIMGLPMGLQYSITAIGSVILQTAVNTLGSGAVAAMTAGSRISTRFYHGNLRRTERWRRKIRSSGKRYEICHHSCRSLLRSDPCCHHFPCTSTDLSVYRSFGQCQYHTGCRTGQTISDHQHLLLYASVAGQYCSFSYPGNGLFRLCCICRCI